MPIALIASLASMQVLLLFVNLAVYETVADGFGVGHHWWLQALFVLLAFSFLVFSDLAHKYRNRFIGWCYTASAYWFGLIHFWLIASAAFLIVARVMYANQWYIDPLILLGISYGALFLLHLYGTWQSGYGHVRHIRIEVPGLPASWKGKKIAVVSDLHLGTIRKEGFTAKIVRKIQSFAPDAAFIVGDLYDGGACDVAAVIEPLRGLRPPKGTFFVTGNHEYFMPRGEWQKGAEALRDLGIRILHNEAIDLDGVTLAGVDDSDAHNNFVKAIHGIKLDPSRPSIILEHRPEHLPAASKAGFSLMISGHTHGGQIFPLNFVTGAVYRGFDRGLKRFDNTLQVYTSSGVGTWGPPLRLWIPSEIVCVTLI